MNVLITGTSSGIGKGCAKYFLKNGHKVYGFDRKESTIEHPDYKHYCLDIRDKEMYPELPPIQIVINNAGVQNEDDIDINLKGTIAVTEHYAVQPEIRSVIMIGSASGHTGSEFPEYAASKGGVLSYTKNVAMRIAPYQATCNSLDFGGVMTELNKPVMEDETMECDHGSDSFKTLDECGRSCRMDLFYGSAKQILHRPEYSDRWTGSRKQ